jgi:hypothetical protein
VNRFYRKGRSSWDDETPQVPGDAVLRLHIHRANAREAARANVLNVTACPIDCYEHGEGYQVKPYGLREAFDLRLEDYEASTAKNVKDQEQDDLIDCEADQRVHAVHKQDELAYRQEESHEADNERQKNFLPRQLEFSVFQPPSP